MFLGKISEARNLYAEHRGQIVDEPDKRSWEQVVLKDFDDLEKAGITHSEITGIREMLKIVGPASTTRGARVTDSGPAAK